MILILCTVPDENVAEKISKELVKNKLSPCVNIIGGVHSIYFWENKIEDGRELLLLIKTKREFFSSVKDFIHKNHPYDVPEIISFKIDEVSQKYKKWFLEYLED